MSTRPEDRNRRSFVYPRLLEAGAEFGDVSQARVALAYPGRHRPPLGLADLSPLPRVGIRGRNALAWLEQQGWPVPTANNAAVQTSSAGIVVRLRDDEALVLSSTDTDAGGHEVLELESALPGENAWHTPRRESHCWFELRGVAAVDCLAKLCGVDLRPQHFPVGSVCQTSVARLNTIVYAGFHPNTPVFGLLADSGSAIWFWDMLLDAMSEYDGGPIGLYEDVA